MNEGVVKTDSIDFSNMSDSFEDIEDDMNMYQFGVDDTSWQKGMEEEGIQDLVPLFELCNLSTEPPKSEFLPVANLTEQEQRLEDFGPRNIEPTELTAEPIECVLVNLAHLEEFPKPASPYSATLPSIFAWFDAHAAFPNEFPTTIQNYFKVMYSSIRQHVRFFFSISPSLERMKNLGTVRREVPTGRILFHYVGHGFPTITEENIWCSERRWKRVEKFRLADLFKQLLPPTWYIFDCSKAALAIKAFKKTAAELSASEGDRADWNDWLCFCATSEDEELPDDPRLPRDFLTSTLLTPIRMAVICHMLQFYRLNLVSPAFPLDCQYEHLWNDRSPEANRLSMTLTAVTDAIAADSLSPDLYKKMFRGDRLSVVLSRRFLLAQYLLRPYRVHPVSYPEISDLSAHPIWRQWGIILDTAICTTPVPRPTIADDLFTRTAISFEVLMHSDQFDVIKPYHLTLLFHMLLCDPGNDQSILLLSEYASDPRADHDMLVAATVFSPLFTRLIMKDPKSTVFYPLAFLILILLRDNPEFANDIRKDLDVSQFPLIVFDHEVSLQIRVVCAAIIADLVVSHEMFQRVCTSKEYLDSITEELKLSCDNSLAGWLFIIIRRGFNLYSPDVSFFTSNGLHLVCSVAIGSDCYIVRSAALSVITCFMSPFECKYNSQLFLMALKAIGDPSFFVRFHFVLLLKKFISSYDTIPERFATVDDFDNSTFAKLHDSILISEPGKSEYESIDNLMNSEIWKSQSYYGAVHLLSMYAKDPHPSVASLAAKIIQFTAKRRSAFESVDESFMSGPSSLSKSLSGDQYIVCYGDDELEEEHTMFANIDQNDALHQITMRLLITTSRASPHSATAATLELTEFRKKLIDDKIIFVRFMQETNAVIAATYKTVFYVTDTHVRSYTIDDTSICDINDMHQGYPLVIIATNNGGVLIWDPEQGLNMAIRADSRFDGFTNVLCARVSNNTIATMRNDGCFCIWNVRNRTILMEKKIEIPSNIKMFDMKDDTIMIGCDDGTAAIFNVADSHLSIVNRNGILKAMVVAGDKLLCFSDTWETYPLSSGLQMRACSPDCCLTGENIVMCESGEFHDFNGSSGKIDAVEGAICCAGHIKEPFVVFGTDSGEIVCKQIMQINCF